MRTLASKRRSAVPSVVVARLAAMVKSANADAEASEEPQEDEQEEPATTFGRPSASGAAAAGEEGNAGPATASGGAEEGTGSGPGPLEEEWEDWCEDEEEAWEEPEGAADQSAEAGPKSMECAARMATYSCGKWLCEWPPLPDRFREQLPACGGCGARGLQPGHSGERRGARAPGREPLSRHMVCQSGRHSCHRASANQSCRTLPRRSSLADPVLHARSCLLGGTPRMRA